MELIKFNILFSLTQLGDDKEYQLPLKLFRGRGGRMSSCLPYELGAQGS